MYETEADRIRKRLKETLTPWEKVKNFWFYHKFHVLLGVLALALAGYFLFTDSLTEKADYSVLYVSPNEPGEALEEALTASLSALGTDQNGDGKVVVTLHKCILDLAALDAGQSQYPEQERSNLAALEGDLASCQSGIILTDTPEALQAHSVLMLGLDGNAPEDEEGVDKLFLSWKDVFETLPEGSSLSIGMRRWWTKGQKEKLAADLSLWEAVVSLQESK